MPTMSCFILEDAAGMVEEVSVKAEEEAAVEEDIRPRPALVVLRGERRVRLWRRGGMGGGRSRTVDSENVLETSRGSRVQ